MSPVKEIVIGANADGHKTSLLGSMANRHGLVSGATGTGKTVTLQVLAEGFSRMGVPVFTADVKGDLSGLAMAGSEHPKITERLEKIGVEDFEQRAYPSLFWDVYGKRGHFVRTTISELGPVLLGRLLGSNDTQEGVLQIAFRVADDEGLLLLDLKDLQSLLAWMSDNLKEIKSEYGQISPASLGAIQRDLLALEEEGAGVFFGEPALQLSHLMQKDFSGNGVISVLDARELIHSPRAYTTFLLWLLSELFEELEEVGDSDKPRLVFFFDEAHLLFDQAPKALLDKVEQVVRLIRSKGVGVYFVTQKPSDIPDEVLGQLGNRVQHALRAFTPKDQKAVKVAAQTFRQNPNINIEQEITQLGVGEALVSTLDVNGVPSVVEKLLVCPPESRIGPATDEEREEVLDRSPLKGMYEEAVDRESAFELLKVRAEEEAKLKQIEESAPKKSRRQGAFETFFKSVARSVGYQIGRQIVRGVLGSITRASR